MASFQDILAKITTAGQIAEAVTPAIQAFSADHVAGTQQILQIAGAATAAETSDPQVQAEAVAAAQVAVTFVPLIFKLLGLFGHKKTPTVPGA